MINCTNKKIKSRIVKMYFYSYYYYYLVSNGNIRSKIKDILKLNEDNINLSADEQEEQALPGMNKYLKTGWYKYMLGRYLFSLKYIKNKRVLDTACGLGWGSYLIADYTQHILSVDIDNESLDFARKKWKSNKLKFKKLSILELSNLTKKFDVVLSYEVIEHLIYNDGEIYIEGIAKVLTSKGILILSSYFPTFEEEAKASERKNKYHPHIYTKSEMATILEKNNFHSIKYYGDLIITAEKNVGR
jgi:2-polyprenyl-3-methyl-5-hydroxy-6-metoxy-1,4-benzoquinol methylase